MLLLLLAMAVSAFMVPFFPTTGDLVRVDVHVTGDSILLDGGPTQLVLPLVDNDVYSSENPLDFFPEIIDPTTLQRVEFLPYGDSVSCNVLTGQGRSVAGNYRFCLAIAIKLDVPVFVHKDLFETPAFSRPESLQA